MALVIALWTLAMVSGLSWARGSTSVFTALTTLVFLVTPTAALDQGLGWFQCILLVLTPWALAASRLREERHVRRLQQEEAHQMAHLQETARSLLSLQVAMRRLEEQISHITDVYHVTKQTSRALHFRELFDSSLDLAPRLLNASGVRLVDFSDDSPVILRARRSPDGRLIPEEPSGPIQEVERHVVEQTRRAGRVVHAEAGELGVPPPEGISRLAWAPLWCEQKPIGILIAENLPEEQVKTLAIVADQLALQLSRIHLYQQVESMAVTDTLTGLFVRRYFTERAQEELARAKRHGLSCTLLMADLDHFKQKNDTYGHLVGDVILREVAQLLKRNMREIDLIARYGGEEFILLLVETTVDQAMPITERLRQLVEIHPIRAYDELLSQTISVGVAAVPGDAQELEALIERSDQALYAAKRAGRNTIVRYSDKLASV